MMVVFDRGNNSKSNLSEDVLKIHYVGAFTNLIRNIIHFNFYFEVFIYKIIIHL